MVKLNFIMKPKVVLDIRKEERPLKLSDEVRESFNQNILFYLEKEGYPFLHTFVEIDFEKNKIIYYHTFSEENVKKTRGWNYSSHSSHSIGRRGFFNFLFMNPNEKKDLFRFIDKVELKMYVFSISDILGEQYDYVSETSGMSYDKDGHFFIGAGKIDSDSYEIFSFSYNLGEIYKICDVPNHKYPAHDIQQYGDHIFATEFFDQRTKIGELEFKDYLEVEDYIFNGNSVESMVADRIEPHKVVEIPKFKITPLPGSIFIHNIKTRKNLFCESGFTPSHLEFHRGNVYISSHNFMYLNGKMVYFGPASINKYKIDYGEIKYESTFNNSKGYRYTAHKIFVRNGEPKIATIGHPNRLFIIDGISMDKYDYIDLGENVLDKVDDVKTYLNKMDHANHWNPLRYSTMESSYGGRYLLLWDQQDILIIDTVNMKIIEKSPFIIDGFYQKTYHSEKL